MLKFIKKILKKSRLIRWIKIGCISSGMVDEHRSFRYALCPSGIRGGIWAICPSGIRGGIWAISMVFQYILHVY